MLGLTPDRAPGESRANRSLPRLTPRFLVTLAAGALIAVLACIVWFGSLSSVGSRIKFPPAAPSFAGPSDRLAETSIVPDLNAPWPPARNAIWCASLSGAWHALAQEVIGGPIMLEGAQELCDRLNSADDPGSFVDPGDYYAAAGWVRDGIIERIHRELGQRFPDKELPSFLDIIPGSMLAYAYMAVQVRFDRPYLDCEEPLPFVNGTGGMTLIKSFGLPPGSVTGPRELRQQVEVLYDSRPFGPRGTRQFAIDLCRMSHPYQVIVAHVPRLETLAATVDSLEEAIREQGETGRAHLGLSANSILLVPALCWRIRHQFAELERRPFLNEGIEGPTLNCVLQDTEFRLDRSGVQLQSEAKMYTFGLSSNYIFDGPFLILVRERESGQPLFVMWVETAELLQPWQA